ncbi:MAG: LysM domain-containing protein [Gammaproteobacteria bacterium]|nr:MAG: LysM domain-containing protein [Gammaproteobacteria bacterium]
MRNRHIIWATLALLLSVAVGAQNVELNPRHPDRYVVVEGDTLWDIAERFLMDPWHWPEIWHHNQQIDNPHLIYPGDVISLSYVDGQPRLTLSRRTVKLSPHTRREPRPKPIPVVPLSLIKPFMFSPWVVLESDFEQMPYVVANEQGMLVAAAPFNTYVRGLGDARKGERFALVHQANVYRDGIMPPDSMYRERLKEDRRTPDDTRTFHGDPDKTPRNWNHDPWYQGAGGNLPVLGIELIEIGSGHVTVAGDIATLRIDESRFEVRPGTRLIPYHEYPYDPFFYPRAPDFPVHARVVGLLGPHNEVVGQYDTVVIDKGSRDGIQQGFVLEAYVPGREVRDEVRYPMNERWPWKSKGMVSLPEEHAGRMLVYRTFDKVSYAIVVEATKEIRLSYLVTNPSSRSERKLSDLAETTSP